MTTHLFFDVLSQPPGREQYLHQSLVARVGHPEIVAVHSDTAQRIQRAAHRIYGQQTARRSASHKWNPQEAHNTSSRPRKSRISGLFTERWR